MCRDLLPNGESTQPRQTQIQYDEVGRSLFEMLERFDAVPCLLDVIAFDAQGNPPHASQFGVVFDDQDYAKLVHCSCRRRSRQLLPGRRISSVSFSQSARPRAMLIPKPDVERAQDFTNRASVATEELVPESFLPVCCWRWCRVRRQSREARPRQVLAAVKATFAELDASPAAPIAGSALHAGFDRIVRKVGREPAFGVFDRHVLALRVR